MQPGKRMAFDGVVFELWDVGALSDIQLASQLIELQDYCTLLNASTPDKWAVAVGEGENQYESNVDLDNRVRRAGVMQGPALKLYDRQLYDSTSIHSKACCLGLHAPYTHSECPMRYVTIVAFRNGYLSEI